MIQKYCLVHHGESSLCEDCRELQEYAFRKIENCPWGEDKPICSKCPIHCYNKKMRLKIIEVMKFSGPKMLVSHPWISAKYLLQKMKKPPSKESLKNKIKNKS